MDQRSLVLRQLLACLILLVVSTMGYGDEDGDKLRDLAQPKLKVAANDTSDATVVDGTTGQLSTTVSEHPSDQKFLGMIDSRPSYMSSIADWHTENIFELGYQFSKDQKLDYVQYVNTNLTHANVYVIANNGAVDVQDGFLRWRQSLWEDARNGTALSFQSRLYVPTWATRRDVGFLFFSRNYFTLSQKAFGDFVEFSVSEVPAYYAYTQAGGYQFGQNMANAIWENMVILNTDIHFSKMVTLSIPIILQSTKYRDYMPGAAINDRWFHFWYAWPELDVQVSDHVMLGLAYYTDDLVKDDLSNTAFFTGFQRGTLQFIFNTTL